MKKNTIQAAVYLAMLDAQSKFEDCSDEWVELELIIADYAYHNGCKIWEDCDNCACCPIH